MTKQKESAPLVNLKEQNACHTFTVKVRDTAHFYRIVQWMNTNVGKGKEFWTTRGKVRRFLSEGKPHDTTIYVFVPTFETESALFLNLV